MNVDGADGDAEPNFAGEVGVAACQVPGIVECAPANSKNVNALVVTPRNSDGTNTTAADPQARLRAGLRVAVRSALARVLAGGAHERRELGPSRHLQLAERAGQVALDRPHAEKQRVGDLAVALAGGDQLRDLALA